MPFIAGYKGRLRINGVNLKVNRWSVDWTSDTPDVTSLESLGYEGFIGTVKELTITFDAFYDTVDNPYAGPITLIPGNYYEIFLYYDKNNMGANRWTLSPILCLSAHNETSPRDVPRYTFTGKFSEYRDDSFAYDGFPQVVNIPTDLPFN